MPQPRRTQAERRAQSRSALLEAAARAFSRQGYARTSLADVSSDAGYTRGALYHQFAGKEELALAVVEWIAEVWALEVGSAFDEDGAPAEKLLTLARRHAVFCRRDVAATMRVLRVEFSQGDHPVARALTRVIESLDRQCCEIIRAGRKDGSIPSGPPATLTAAAITGALEAVGVEVSGRSPHDVALTERAVRGILGLNAQ